MPINYRDDPVMAAGKAALQKHIENIDEASSIIPACLDAMSNYFGAKVDLSIINSDKIKLFAQGWREGLREANKPIPEELDYMCNVDYSLSAEKAGYHALSDANIVNGEYGAEACIEHMKEYFKTGDLSSIQISQIKNYATGWARKLRNAEKTIPEDIIGLCEDGYTSQGKFKKR